MDSLNFSTGIKTFDVNDGAAQVSYNPTDANFAAGLYELFMRCADRYEADKDKAFDSNVDFFAYARQRDTDVCEGIDGLFGSGVSASLFQGISPYALADGLPLWANFLLSVIDTIPEEMSRQVKVSKPRVEKYLKKYHR